MSWKNSTLWTLAVISVIATIFIIFPGIRPNFIDGNHSVQQLAPKYNSHIIKGQIFLNNKPLKLATVMFYKPDNLNELIIDKDFEDGKYEIDIAYLPSGWSLNEVGILEVQTGKETFKKTIIIKNTPVQVEDVLLYGGDKNGI